MASKNVIIWVEGQVYTHLDSSSNPQGGEWRTMSVQEFAERARVRLVYDHSRTCRNVDHLEVFTPRSARISSAKTGKAKPAQHPLGRA